MKREKFLAFGLLSAGSILYFFANIQRVAIPGAVFDLLQNQLHLSAPYITALGSSFMYVYAASQLIVGLLADRYCGRRVILIGGILFILGEGLFALSNNIAVLYAARALTGFGASMFYLSLVNETMRLYPGNYAIALSFVIMVGYGGGIFANAPFTAIVNVCGLRSLLISLAAGTVLAYLAYLYFFRKNPLPAVKTDIPISFSRFKLAVATRHNRMLNLFFSLNFGLYYCIQTVIGKKFLQDYCEIGENAASLILSLMGILAACSSITFATLSKLTGNRRQIFIRIAGCYSAVAFTAMTLMLAFNVRGMLFAAAFCVLSMTASMTTISVPLFKETNPENSIGAIVSFMNCSAYVAVAVFGNLVGFLMNIFAPEQVGEVLKYSRNSYLTVFLFLLICSYVVCYASMQIKETFGHHIEVD